MGREQQNFKVIDTPQLDDYTLKEFRNLPLDPYTGSQQRYRRFSQYRVDHDGTGWKLTLLPQREFSQPAQHNSLVGGVMRVFEPLTTDPSQLINAGFDSLDFDLETVWQINVHQCRVVSTPEVEGVAAPEGPHRDGHRYGMVAVTKRHNIKGGEKQLLPLGGGTPFFTTTLQDNEAIIFDDTAIFHNVTDIEYLTEEGGFRDVWLIAINPWKYKRYGEDYDAEVRESAK